MECSDIDLPENTPKLRRFLAQIKARIGPKKTLSVAIPTLTEDLNEFHGTPYVTSPWVASLTSSLRPIGPARAPRVYEVVFAEADQVVTMLYDTWLAPGQQEVYVNHVSNQVWAGAWFGWNFGTEFLPGIRLSTQDGTKRSEDGSRPPYHSYEVENPTTASRGLDLARARPLGDGSRVEDRVAGVAIFRFDVIYEPGFQREVGAVYLEGFRKLGPFGRK